MNGRVILTVLNTEHGAYLTISAIGNDNSVYLTNAEIDQLIEHLSNGADGKTRRFG